MSTSDPSANSNEWVGSTFSSTKEANTFRVLFQNVNSFGATQYQHNIQEFANAQDILQVDFAGITEHCLNISQPKILNSIQQSLNKFYRGQYAIQFNSADIQTLSTYLPGGTAALIIGDHTSRIEPQGRGGDHLGRWSFFTLRRKLLPPLTIYTVYKVCKQPTNQIGITAWHQQRLLLDQQNRHHEHPREAFTKDLIASIQHHQSLHHQVIVGGDFNDTLFTNRSQLLRLANATQLTDPWTALYPQFENFHTYQRGASRIDSVLMSHELVETIKNIGYSPFNWFTTSDHRALLIDFDMTRLFCDQTNMLHPTSLRGLRSNDKNQVATFINHCHDHLMQNNAFAKISHLKDRTLTPNQVETLDELLGQAFTAAQNRCKRRRNPLYTTKLAQLRTLRSITRGNFNALKREHYQTSIFQNHLNRHGIPYSLAETTKEAWDQFKQVNQELQEALKEQREIRIQEQQSMIDKAHIDGNSNRERAIKNIAKQEARRRTWQTLRYVRMQKGLTQKLDRDPSYLATPTH